MDSGETYWFLHGVAALLIILQQRNDESLCVGTVNWYERHENQQVVGRMQFTIRWAAVTLSWGPLE